MADRKLTCLSLVEHTNGLKVRPAERCSSERLPGSRYCAHHLAEAHREYMAITEGFSDDEGGGNEAA